MQHFGKIDFWWLSSQDRENAERIKARENISRNRSSTQASFCWAAVTVPLDSNHWFSLRKVDIGLFFTCVCGQRIHQNHFRLFKATPSVTPPSPSFSSYHTVKYMRNTNSGTTVRLFPAERWLCTTQMYKTFSIEHSRNHARNKNPPRWKKYTSLKIARDRFHRKRFPYTSDRLIGTSVAFPVFWGILTSKNDPLGEAFWEIRLVFTCMPCNVHSYLYSLDYSEQSIAAFFNPFDFVHVQAIWYLPPYGFSRLDMGTGL